MKFGMRFISSRVHGMMDYLMGVLLIISPYLFGFATGGAKQWLPTCSGKRAYATDQVFWPHVILALIEISTACFTETRSTVKSRAATARS